MNFSNDNQNPKMSKPAVASIKIIGVGGGGSNAVNQIYESGETNSSEFYVLNTDQQALNSSTILSTNKLTLGPKTTRGLGAGADPKIAKRAAEESIEDIKEIVKGGDLIFVTAGMGGGTGSGASPLIARAAKEAGALVVAIVTTPFAFEGTSRVETAKSSLAELKKEVDSIIVVSNDKLNAELGSIPITKAFSYADLILKKAIVTITDIISVTSIINLDFADIKTVLKNQGLALIGMSEAEGDDASIDAAMKAIKSPILESSIDGAKKAVVMVVGSETSLTIEKAHDAITTIKEAANSNIDIIFGVRIDDSLGSKVSVSVIATGLEKNTQGFVGEEDIISSNEFEDSDELNVDFHREIDNSLERGINSDEKPLMNNNNIIDDIEDSETEEKMDGMFTLLDDDNDDDDNSTLIK